MVVQSQLFERQPVLSKLIAAAAGGSERASIIRNNRQPIQTMYLFHCISIQCILNQTLQR